MLQVFSSQYIVFDFGGWGGEIGSPPYPTPSPSPPSAAVKGRSGVALSHALILIRGSPSASALGQIALLLLLLGIRTLSVKVSSTF